MDRHYAMQLLREAVADPGRLSNRSKFWRVELFRHYLRRCDDLLFDAPAEALSFTKAAPAYAAKVAAASPAANGADCLLLAYSYLGGAYRRVSDYSRSEESFAEARKYRESASPQVLAEHLRRFAYLRMVQHQPEVFPLIEEAIAIHKRGNLVNRHELGQCLSAAAMPTTTSTSLARALKISPRHSITSR